ncbi:B12-binding domain-containing protein [Deltaproteobacteria bacterium OttesenSCG-928-K17]|nr:B12-binding domain-containing protein [Deltaproteobacteria bacterium OttesenSCG-928-K17]
MTNAIYQQAIDSIVSPDETLALEAVKKHLDTGTDPMELMNNGFIVGIAKVGDLFGAGKLFLPELMLAADVMLKASQALNEALPPGEQSGNADIHITAATVKGDIHDIGKGIGIALFRANGFTVHDLGRDVDTEVMINDAVKNGSRVIATSALLTTTLSEQKKLEDTLKKAGLKGKIKTMVAGAPVTPRWASRIGADIYAENAHDGVQGVLRVAKEAVA